jgi:hypothetical protein
VHEKKKREWADTSHEKEWVIDGYEVKAGSLKDALMVEVRYRMPLYAAVLEDQHDDEQDFLYEKEQMLDELDEEDEEPSDEAVWDRVWDSRSVWCDHAFWDITHKNATADDMLEAIHLHWGCVEIHAIQCERNYCDELVDVQENHPCPSCDYFFCQECVDEDEDGECPGCGHKRTALDAMVQAVEDARKEAA